MVPGPLCARRMIRRAAPEITPALSSRGPWIVAAFRAWIHHSGRTSSGKRNPFLQRTPKLEPSERAMCNLTNPLPLCNPSRHLRADERGSLTEVSKTAEKKVSGLMLKISRLLAPPIHPRVPTSVPLPSLRLIIGAGRGDALRSA